MGSRRYRRCARHAVPYQEGGIIGSLHRVAHSGKSIKALARQVSRTGWPRAARPAALCRSDDEARCACNSAGARQSDLVDPASNGTGALYRSRNADVAPDSGRRGGAALCHASSRARDANVLAHRARAVFETAAGGGFERVFEINRNFRNEGVSARHNPEFTMLEFYAAYTNYRWMMDFTEQLIRQTAIDALGTARIQYQGRALDLERPFRRWTLTQAIREQVPAYCDAPLDEVEFLRIELRELGMDIHAPAFKNAGIGALQLALFEERAESKCWAPTYIVDYPLEVSPLARASDTRPEIAERFELFIAGRETANGFSELNDPIDQAARFRKQAEQKEAGDDEAMHFDADYIRALEYGMPPAGGCGIGIDRLVMLLTDCASIRDVILFPHVRRADCVRRPANGTKNFQ